MAANTPLATTSLNRAGRITRSYVGEVAMADAMADHQARYSKAYAAWIASPEGAASTAALGAVKNRAYAEALRAGVLVGDPA